MRSKHLLRVTTTLPASDCLLFRWVQVWILGAFSGELLLRFGSVTARFFCFCSFSFPFRSVIFVLVLCILLCSFVFPLSYFALLRFCSGSLVLLLPFQLLSVLFMLLWFVPLPFQFLFVCFCCLGLFRLRFSSDMFYFCFRGLFLVLLPVAFPATSSSCLFFHFCCGCHYRSFCCDGGMAWFKGVFPMGFWVWACLLRSMGGGLWFRGWHCFVGACGCLLVTKPV